MKRLAIRKFNIILLIGVLFLGTSCAPLNHSQTSNSFSTINSGLYIGKWYAFTGVTDIDDVHINIPFVLVSPRANKKNSASNILFNLSNYSYTLNEFKLKTENGIIIHPINIKWIKGNKIHRFTLYTLNLTFSHLLPKRYLFTSLYLPIDKKEYICPIKWVVDVYKQNMLNNCVTITGETTLSGSILTGMSFVARNNCKSPIILDNVLFKLQGLNLSGKLFVTNQHSFDKGTNNPLPESPKSSISSTQKFCNTINPNDQRLVEVKIENASNVPPFIAIKPLLIYHKKGDTEKFFTEFYSPIIFSMFPQSANDVEDMFSKGDFIKLQCVD